MRIYMAGFMTGRSITMGTASVHTLVSRNYRYPWLLESFHYIHNKPAVAKTLREEKRSIFLDSGAFSMFTQGVKVDLKSYARFVLHNKDIIHVASNLDVIGKGFEQESYERQKQLEVLMGEHKNLVMPVHHVRDDDKWLERYMGEGYDYIFIGGMVPETTPALRERLDTMWTKHLINQDGTPKIKVHGFGLTAEPLMFRYPWYSIDSTQWVMASRFGALMVDFPQPDGTLKVLKIDFSIRSPRRHDFDLHFWNTNSEMKQQILQRLDEMEAEREKDPEVEALFEQQLGCKLGFNPEALSKSYGIRDVGNMEYYRRAMRREVTKFTHAQETLFE